MFTALGKFFDSIVLHVKAIFHISTKKVNGKRIIEKTEVSLDEYEASIKSMEEEIAIMTFQLQKLEAEKATILAEKKQADEAYEAAKKAIPGPDTPETDETVRRAVSAKRKVASLARRLEHTESSIASITEAKNSLYASAREAWSILDEKRTDLETYRSEHAQDEILEQLGRPARTIDMSFSILEDMSALRKCREDVKKSLADVHPRAKTVGEDYGKMAKEVLAEIK
jgi:chromosome segregation ATPase